MFCQKCGNQIDDNATSCPGCGTLTKAAEPQQSPAGQPVINIVNTNTNANTNTNNNAGGAGNPKNKWVALHFVCYSDILVLINFMTVKPEWVYYIYSHSDCSE